MTEHVHEWVWCLGLYRCRDKPCNKVMSTGEAAYTLNEYETLKAATERLSAELQVWLENTDAKHGIHMDKEILAEWLDILEGKDG